MDENPYKSPESSVELTRRDFPWHWFPAILLFGCSAVAAYLVFFAIMWGRGGCVSAASAIEASVLYTVWSAAFAVAGICVSKRKWRRAGAALVVTFMMTVLYVLVANVFDLII